MDVTVHLQSRALDFVERQQILNHCRSGLAPIRFVALMRDSNVTITPRYVYNIRDAERRHLLRGRTPLAALFDGLNQQVFVHHTLCNLTPNDDLRI